MPAHDAVETILTTDVRGDGAVGSELQGKHNAATMLLNKLAFREEVQTRYPAIVGLDIVQDCNLDCRHCFLKSRDTPGEYLSLDRLDAFKRDLLDAKPLKVYLTGGEPMLHPEFYEVLDALAFEGFDLTVFTNGLLLTPDAIDQLERYRDRIQFQISLDGLGTAHEEIRGVPAEHVLDGISRLTENGFDVHTRTTVQPANVEQIPEIYETVVDLGVDYAEFAPLLPTFGWESMSDEPYDEFVDRSLRLYASFLEERDSFPVPIGREPIPVPCGYDLPDDVALDAYLCPAGNTALEVDIHGEVYPCPYMHFEQFSAGNVFEEERDLLTIWQESCAEPEWACMCAYTNVAHEACYDCEVRDDCKGSCPAASFAANGTISEPDYRCPKIMGD